jgi:predicted CoA-binding protein
MLAADASGATTAGATTAAGTRAAADASAATRATAESSAATRAGADSSGAELDLSRLLRPRSVAVVGATDRPGSYGDATLRNLAALDFPGPVWGVHPTRREVHGRPCVAAIDDLPEPVDAVVVAIPAAGVPEVVRAAGRRGCGGLVVFAAGFAEAGEATLQAELRDVAKQFALPLIGPNCDGIVAFHAGAALWGDALVPRAAGRVALVSQSGNVAVNALALGRGLRFHGRIGRQPGGARRGRAARGPGRGRGRRLRRAVPRVRRRRCPPGARARASRGARRRRRRAEGRRDRGGRDRGGRAYRRAGRRSESVPSARRRGGRRVGRGCAPVARAGEGAAGRDDVVVLVEAMAASGVELLVAAKRDAVVPALVVGLGGIWTELLDDVAIVPLPAAPARVEAALRTLRGFGLLSGARGGGAVDLAALAELAARAGELLLAEELTLLELNPVIASAEGAVAIDAVAQTLVNGGH